ncbi:hypothetical protein OIV83_000584 [Microbotryomycetes sp. JL201]|nr:hypothetical protein OIV83_000584 [Microbotryomycetes sp. JL201]
MPRRNDVPSRTQQTLVHATEAVKLASTNVDGPRRSSSKRWLRANVVLGKILSALTASFILRGSRLVLGDTARYIDVIQRRPKLALAYKVHFVVWLIYLVASFYCVYFASDSQERNTPPAKVRDKLVVYECDEKGEPSRCYLDNCKGSFKSIRTRHCRDCAKCRPGFDHHCPFVDACVYRNSFKPFVCFMAPRCIGFGGTDRG